MIIHLEPREMLVDGIQAESATRRAAATVRRKARRVVEGSGEEAEEAGVEQVWGEASPAGAYPLGWRI